MGVIIKDKLIIISEPNAIQFDWPKDLCNDLKHEIDFIIKQNEFLTENTIKIKDSWLLSKYKHGNDIHRKQKTVKWIKHTSLFNLSHMLDLKDTLKAFCDFKNKQQKCSK